MPTRRPRPRRARAARARHNPTVALEPQLEQWLLANDATLRDLMDDELAVLVDEALARGLEVSAQIRSVRHPRADRKDDVVETVVELTVAVPSPKDLWERLQALGAAPPRLGDRSRSVPLRIPELRGTRALRDSRGRLRTRAPTPYDQTTMRF